MDLQFNQSVMKCLACGLKEYQTQEQTQEIRIPEGMPDVGLVLACWGQVVIRGKEWRSEHVGVSGGVTVKVLYLPEEAGVPQVVEAWLPFQMKWTIPGANQDGVIQVMPGLRSADARVLSARKMMVRTNIGMSLQALVPTECTVYQPESLPEDVQLLRNSNMFAVAKEAGEKAFGLDEVLEFPASDPKLEQVICATLSPQVLEEKVLADKLIFRGICIAHVLYRSTDGQLCSRDFDVPFSQYADLGQEFDSQAQMQVIPAITNMELELTPEGGLHLKAGICGQYVVYDQVTLDMPQDAYSPFRPVKTITGQVNLPVLSAQTEQSMTAQADPQVDVMRAVDVAFWPEQPYVGRDGDLVEADLGGMFQLLYYDPDGLLQSSQTRWADTVQLEGNGGSSVSLQLSGKPSYGAGMLSVDLRIDTAGISPMAADMLSGLELGELAEPDPMRPSIVVAKAGNQTLWDIAKENGSTVEKIRTANALEAEPTPDSVLLIPVL